MTKETATCQSCGKDIAGEIYHLGFSNMEALYCSSCPKVLLLSDFELIENRNIIWPHLKANDEGWQYYDRHLLPVYSQIEKLFKDCNCGGRFGFMNPPRCPKCSDLLRGNCYEDKPILKQRDRYIFVCGGSVTDKEQLLV